MCGECLQCLGHTEFAPSHSVCAFPVYTAQAPGCSARELSKTSPGLHALPRSMSLKFRFLGTAQRHRLSWACLCWPSQVQAAQVTRCLVSTLSPGVVHLITSLFPAAQFPRRTAGVPSQGFHVSPLGSWSLAGTFLVDVNRPGSQEDLVSNWELACSGAEFAPSLLALGVAFLPLCLRQGMGRSSAG